MELNEFKRRLKKVKLIVSDVDGTLLNKEYELPAECREMVHKLMGKNILFGRAMTTLYQGWSMISHPNQKSFQNTLRV